MRKLLTAMAGAAALLAAGAAQAVAYSNLFVFGDSLVDAGNARRADPTQANPALGYYDGRFSNGPTFADVVSAAITGGPTAPVLKAGTVVTDFTKLTPADLDPAAHNFAVGGAQAAEVAGDRSPSLLEQIGVFAASGQRLAPDSLVLLAIGGNDVRSAVAAFAPLALAAAATGQPIAYTPDFSAADAALSAGLGALIAAGARNIILVGAPDIGQIPAVTGLPLPAPVLQAVESEATALSRLINGDFAGVLAGKAAPGLALGFYDLLAEEPQLFRDVAAAAPGGTLNTTTPCLLTAGAPACDGYVYFDPIHPTGQVHAAIGNAIVQRFGIAAVPEPAAWMPMILGFGMIGAGLRRRAAAARA